MARIAVTGATGFVGRVLLRRLTNEGHEVRALVRSAPDSLPAPVVLVNGDVRRPESLRDLVAGVDAVVHLADSFDLQERGEDLSTAGTRAVLEALRESGGGHVVYMSCLGARAGGRALYNDKWRAEMLVRDSGLPFTILLPSLVLGPGDPVTRGLEVLVRSLPVVPVPGRGEQRRQPIDVEDLCRCVTESLTRAECRDQMISVGGPVFVTVRQLVDLVAGHLGLMRPKVLVPPRWLHAIAPVLPAAARSLFSPGRLALLQQDVVASPGIVSSIFGFEPASVVHRLPAYLARENRSG